MDKAAPEAQLLTMETSSARNGTSLIDQITSAASLQQIADRVAALESRLQSLTRLIRTLLPQPDTGGFVLPVQGRAGGRARAESAWRWADGTFMAEADRAELQAEARQQDYERYAAGGRARASRAHRGSNGKFQT